MLFSLWLAMVIFFLHAVILHQEHLNSGYESDYQSGMTDDRTPTTPLSCQLFRKISFEKPGINFSGNTDDELPGIFAIMPEGHMSASGFTTKRKEPFNVAEDFPGGFFQENIPVRGSPFSA